MDVAAPTAAAAAANDERHQTELDALGKSIANFDQGTNNWRSRVESKRHKEEQEEALARSYSTT